MDNSEIEKLTKQMKIANRQNLWWYGFWRGVMSGLGATLGVAVILVLLVYIAKKVHYVPLVGDKLNNVLTPITDQLQKNGTVR